jgi:lipopolysaccharide transport system permease protein
MGTTDDNLTRSLAESGDPAAFPMGSLLANGSALAAPSLRIDSRRRWFPDLRAAFASRELLLLLCRRDVTVLYRQTILGSVWILVSPLISALLFTVVFGRVARLSSGGVPYFPFSYAGLLAWTLFSSSLTGASSSIVANQSLFTRIYFPRIILPISQLAGPLINTAISTGVMFVLLVAYHIGFSLRLLLLPAWLGLAILLSVGVSLTLSSIAVLYRDVQYVTAAVLPMLLFLTPVAYSSSNVPHSLKLLYVLNPMAAVVEGCRWSLIGHTGLSIGAVGYTIVLTLVLLAVGLVVFARLERKFADVV